MESLLYLTFFKWIAIFVLDLLRNKVGEGTLPWATPCLGPSRFFFKWEENKYFRLMHIALFLKVTY